MGNMREIIRSNLERYLSESGYTQKEFAEKLGVSKSSVTNWVKGRNSPDVDLVVPICKLLNITIKDFYSDGSSEGFGSQESKKRAPLYSSEARKLAQDYDTLDSYGKRVIRLVIDAEKVRCAEQAQFSRVIKIAGRDGSFTEIRLTDDQIKDLRAYIDQIPDPGDDL